MKNYYKYKLLTSLIFMLAISNAHVTPIAAENKISQDLCELPFQSELLDENAQIQLNKVITAQTISERQRTVPSLWWSKEQFDPFAGRLIANWLAYPEEKRIDLVVNWQLWTILDYLSRYRLINQFGTVARDYGYNLRVFNQQKKCLATYQYDNLNNKWEINLDGSTQSGFQIDKKIFP
jgi:hypothetical protein